METPSSRARIASETATFLAASTGSFTAMADDPRLCLENLLRVERRLGQAIRDHGGSILHRFNGSFCAKFSTAPPALIAAQAVSRLESGPRAIPLLCGVHTGPAFTHGRRCFGSSINTAQNLCALASQYRVMVSATTAALAQGRLPAGLCLTRLDPVQIRGLGEMQLFALSESSECMAAFISYRREGGADTARLVSADLQRRGVRTFLDTDDLGAHHFDERLRHEIQAAPNFVLILSPGSLDRCREEGDWLRREITCAIQTGRNIVPLLKDGFSFPDVRDLPPEMADLPRYNGVSYSHEYFRASMDRLASFLAKGVR